jgi:phosphoribosyl 1,2-cyclic phosphodiesterase
MRAKFYGVRGSIASSGEATARYGGNTSCVVVHVDDRVLIFDAGTGIRPAGDALLRAGVVEPHLFLSHLHWDHIQGFPFFVPAFVPKNTIHVYGADAGGGASVRAGLDAQMRAPHFPVGLSAMRADLLFNDVPQGASVTLGDVVVTHTPVDHPNGCVAWRVEHRGKRLVYATDLEHREPGVHEALVELAAGADLLIFDAMYTPEEYEGDVGPSRKGWGHSTFEDGARLAEAARVKELCLFHHDPSHDDAFMDGLGARARRRFSSTSVAREGLEITL